MVKRFSCFSHQKSEYGSDLSDFDRGIIDGARKDGWSIS